MVNLFVAVYLFLVCGLVEAKHKTPTLGINSCAEGSLWVADGSARIYQIYPNGKLISSFAMPGSVVPSGIARNPATGNLFVVSEAANELYQFTERGVQVGSAIAASTWDADVDPAPETEGVTFDPRDGTLWIVDDGRHNIYHVQTNGTHIDTFQLHEDITGPQGVAFDARDNTLWISDNEDKIIYHIQTNGTRIPADDIPLPAVTDNWQGLGLEPLRRTMWLLTYADVTFAGLFYRVNVATKTLITGTGLPFPSTNYGSALHGSGVVFDYNCI